MHSKVLVFWVLSSFNRQHLNHPRTIPIHTNFFAKMVVHEIPNILCHSTDHGPILVVLQGVLLVGTWCSGKNKHNLSLSKNPTMSTLWAFIPSIIQHNNESLLMKIQNPKYIQLPFKFLTSLLLKLHSYPTFIDVQTKNPQISHSAPHKAHPQ